jgi:L-histidine N-alpha-methyltransferase
MNPRETNYQEQENCEVKNHLPHVDMTSVEEEIIEGLTCKNKRISSVHFYDAEGSRLFEEITTLPEYYPARTEKDLLEELSRRLGGTLKHIDIVELGSGDNSKISILLDAVPPDKLDSLRYIPVDVSLSAIEESVDDLVDSYPGLTIHGMAADFTKQLHRIPDGEKRLFCFLGSTIGNLSRDESIEFLRSLRNVMREGDTLLVGFDMIKDKGTLERAYNDSRGVTAEFNKNILNVANDILGTNFDPDKFEHVAFYSDEYSRIEMHLRALEDLEITCPKLTDPIRIERGEMIHTENSHKFSEEMIEELAAGAGLKIQDWTTDSNQWFYLVRFQKADENPNA